jgi:type II secretory pathway pseudopilin PulG
MDLHRLKKESNGEKMRKKPSKIEIGFTVVEMVAVIAVIAILVSLLVPALNTVREMANTVNQRAQFSSISSAMEAFQADFGDYPQSYENRYACPLGVPNIYCGSQKLAEAIVGYDAFGFHPDSVFSRHNTNDQCDDTASIVYDYTDPCNRGKRKGLYLELETANAVKIQNLYGNPAGMLEPDTYILADTFGKVKNMATQKQTGMPILYYKANVSNFYHSNDPDPLAIDLNIYDVRDNEQIISIPTPFDGTDHPIWIDPDYPATFYNMTANPNFPEPDPATYPFLDNRRPYRAETFILQSAGPDGLYGNSDDVFNFEAN